MRERARERESVREKKKGESRREKKKRERENDKMFALLVLFSCSERVWEVKGHKRDNAKTKYAFLSMWDQCMVWNESSLSGHYLPITKLKCRMTEEASHSTFSHSSLLPSHSPLTVSAFASPLVIVVAAFDARAMRLCPSPSR